MAMNTVLSPAMVPRISGQRSESMASPAADALPVIVLTTIRWPAEATERTQFSNIWMKRSCRSASARSAVAYL